MEASDRQAFSSLGPAAIDHFPSAGRTHPFPEALSPLLLEIAFLCCCFRHRRFYSLSDLLTGGYYKLIREEVKKKTVWKQGFDFVRYFW